MVDVLKPFRKLDDFVLDQFEKVTQKAHKHGRTKYDLIRVMNGGISAANVGFGVYALIMGYLQDKGVAMGFGGGGIGLSVYGHKVLQEWSDKEEASELSLLVRTGASTKDTPHSIHGVMAGMTIGYTAYALAAVIGYNPPGTDWTLNLKDSGLDMEQIQTVGNYIMLCLTANLNFVMAKGYLRRTTMFPPSADKKPLWKIGLKYVSRPFRKKPELAPEVNYNLEDMVK